MSWLNDAAVSWGAAGTQRVLLEAVERVAYGMLRARKSYSSEQFQVTVLDVKGRTLVMPVISYRKSDGTWVTVSADTAELHTNQAENALTLILRNSRLETGGPFSFLDPDTFTLDIPLEAASRSRRISELSASKLPLTVISPRIKQQKTFIENKKEAMAAEAAYQMMSGDFDA